MTACTAFGGSNTFTRVPDVARENATYSCPWENTGTREDILDRLPLRLVDGQRKRKSERELAPLEFKGELSCVRDIRGMKMISPSWSPPTNLHSSTRSDIRSKIIRVPLQRPRAGARFRSRINGLPIFMVSSPGGRLPELIDRKNSTGTGT